MARQPLNTVTSPPDAVGLHPDTGTPPHVTAAQQNLRSAMSLLDASLTQRPSHTDSRNIKVDSDSHVGDLFADPYTAQVATEVYAHIVGAWKLDDSDAEKLLSVNHQSWMRIKNGEWSGLLDREQLMRISAIIGLHEALHSCFNEDLANSWVKRPNTGSIFSGRKPIEVMIEGGLPVMIEARDYMGALLGY